MTAVISGIGLVLPYTPVGAAEGMVALPLSFYGWVAATIAGEGPAGCGYVASQQQTAAKFITCHVCRRIHADCAAGKMDLHQNLLQLALRHLDHGSQQRPTAGVNTCSARFIAECEEMERNNIS